MKASTICLNVMVLVFTFYAAKGGIVQVFALLLHFHWCAWQRRVILKWGKCRTWLMDYNYTSYYHSRSSAFLLLSALFPLGRSGSASVVVMSGFILKLHSASFPLKILRFEILVIL